MHRAYHYKNNLKFRFTSERPKWQSVWIFCFILTAIIPVQIQDMPFMKVETQCDRIPYSVVIHAFDLDTTCIKASGWPGNSDHRVKGSPPRPASLLIKCRGNRRLQLDRFYAGPES